ncbi:hypothetical protein EMIT07CA2_50401 [Brevibacillus sp. IT-7CA2]
MPSNYRRKFVIKFPVRAEGCFFVSEALFQAILGIINTYLTTNPKSYLFGLVVIISKDPWYWGQAVVQHTRIAG